MNSLLVVLRLLHPAEMEEVDKILILTLNHLGCDIDEDIKTVGSFGIAEVVGGIVRCVRAISSDCDLPTSLPQNMAQRFRAAAAVAQAVKDIGYSGDIGYQSLLYPSEADLRRIFMFLIEKLPRDSSPVSDEPLNKATLIHREAKRRLTEALAQPWIPPHCRHIVRTHSSCASITKYGTAHTRGFTSRPFTGYEDPSKLPTEMNNYYENHLRRVTKLVGYSHLVASLLNAHAAQLEKEKFIPLLNTHTAQLENEKLLPTSKEVKGENESVKLELLISDKKVSETTHAVPGTDSTVLPPQIARHMEGVQESGTVCAEGKAVTQHQVATEESAAVSQEEQLTNLENEVASIRSKMKECTQGMLDAQNTLAKLTDEIAQEEELKEERSKDMKTMERTSSLLPESDTNIQKLKTALRNSEEKMGRLQQQWDAHRDPLNEQLSRLTQEMEDKKRHKEKILEDIGGLRDKMKAMVQEASRKESAEAQLKEQVEKITKDVNRSVYTKRIIDISAKVRKQKQEIDRVLADTRTIQKEINILSGKLERTFTVVEGTAYKEAANNERVRQVYRAVAAVHEGCGELVDIVRETGATQREISDLREQVDLEKSKNVEEKLEQLKVDLNQVKKENASLKKQIR